MTAGAMLRPCPSCGTPRTTTCRRCGWTAKAGRLHTPERRRRLAATLEQWRRLHGDWCPGWPDADHRAHSTDDLTVHHIDEDPDGPLTVLCRSANAAIGAPARGTERR